LPGRVSTKFDSFSTGADGPNQRSYEPYGLACRVSELLASAGQGVWAVTGERTAVMTLAILGVEERELRRTIRVRAELTVDATGDGFTGSFTTERIELDGSACGQQGPWVVTGARVKVEPPVLAG
jgi:hypothetical protein